jgi:2-methylcitrate dehydratase PrpD
VAAHVLDFDDTCYAGVVHPSAVIFPAAFAAAEAAEASGIQLLEAFIAGREVEMTLGRMAGYALYEKGWLNTTLLGAIGAAAAAAKAFALDADATCSAITLATTEAHGIRAVLGTQAKPLVVGRAAETGVHAAELARLGVRCSSDVFTSEYGFFSLFNAGQYDPRALTELGRRWALIDPGVAFKLYPVCSAAQAAVEATAEILRAEGLTANDVARVLCEVTPLVHVSLRYNRPTTVQEAQFSMPFAIGCILAYGALDVRLLSRETLSDQSLRSQMDKVEMQESKDFTTDAAFLERCPEGARVTVETHDGRQISRVQGAATGMPQNPMSEAQLAEKFLHGACRVLPPDAARALLSRIHHLERLKSAAALFPEEALR